MKISTSANFLRILLALCAALLPALLAPSSNAQTTTNTFSTAGTTNWVCPTNVFTVSVECWGGGGAGGGARGQSVSPASRAAAGGGAGGAYVRTTVIPVTPGTSYTIVVGAGGVASTNNGVSVAGGDSWFSSQSTIIAKGGAGANSLVTSGSDLTSAGGAGSATGSVGDVVFAGGSGAAGNSPSSASPTGYSGGGGSSAGTATAGNNASTSTGGSAPTGGGAGANGRTSNANPGTSATQVGGGGGGAWAAASTTQRAGGSGAAGQVRLVYSVTAGPTINTSGSLTPFSTQEGTASPLQTFDATGGNLTADITVAAPTDFEVATDGINFADTASIIQSGGLASGTVSVRIKASATAGAKSGNVVLTSTGATSVNVPVTGNVTIPGGPSIVLSTNSLSGISTSVGVASAVTNYLVTGTNLGTTAVTITPSEAFLEIGTNGSTFASTIDLFPTDGAVSNTVFLRVAATNVVTNYSATISHVSGSASNSLAVSGAITNLPPVLAVSTNTLSGFTTTTNVVSAAQTFTVTGSNLTTNVTVGAPTGFEVANDGTTWGTNTLLALVSGSVSNTISVRLGATNVAGTPAGNVTVASGATNRNVAVSGTVTAAAIAFAQGNLVVARYGDGSTALGSAATALSILEVTPVGSTNQVLTSLSSGGFLLTASGTGTSLGYLNTYNANLALPGYNTAVGTAGVANLNTKAANIVGTNATVIGRTTFPTSGTPLPFSGDAFRSAIATDTNKFYASGTGNSGTGGIWFYDGTAYVQVSTNPLANTRNVEIFNGNLYYSTGSGTTARGVYQVGTGLPNSTNQAAAQVIATGTNSSPVGFAFSPDGNTAYIADDGTLVNGGGIQKWTKSGATWSKLYTFTNSARGLAVDFSGAEPVIYATTSAESNNNKLIKITDSGSNAVVSTIAEAGANFVFRGVDFTPSASGPTPIPPTITSTNAFSGTVGVAFSNDVTATGDAPIGFSGTALPGGLSVASGGAITGTPTAAGTFNATLTATNAAGTTNQAVTFTIAKGAVSIISAPTASGLVQGQALLDSFLSGGSASVSGTFAWTDSSIIPPVGTTSYGVTFTPTDAANYNTAATSASVTVLSTYQAGYKNWLTEFQLDPLVTTGPNAGAPNADPDNDGFSNASEYAFGTNPTVPNGALLTTSSSNSVFRSSWAGPASGVTYGVQFSTNLSTMAFSNDPTITIQSVGGVMSFTNQATGNKFFRVRATSN